MTAPAIASARDSIAHAKESIDALATEMQRFADSGPYALMRETLPGDAEEAIVVRYTQSLPRRVRFLVFDAVNALRSALDQAGFACAVASGASGRYAKFPFGDDEKNVRSLKMRGSSQIPTAIFETMVSFQPYEKGDSVLWGLNKLCNSHKHESPLLSAAWASSNHLHDAYFESVSSFTFPPRWDPVKQELQLARVPKGAKVNIVIGVNTSIVFGKGPCFEGLDCIVTLIQLFKRVEKLLDAIETKAGELGLVFQ